MKKNSTGPNHYIPLVHQYGDSSAGFSPDLLHCEALSLRSRQHQFTIRPHRHQGLTQLFLIRHGRGQVHIDGQQSEVQAPMVLVISELCVHDFLWSEDVEGYVLSISHALLEQLASVQAVTIFQQTRLLPLSEAATDNLLGLLQRLHEEYESPVDEHRADSFSSRVSLLAITLQRLARDQGHWRNQEQSRSLMWLQKFTQLINRDYALQRSVEGYAAELGISAQHLNSVCQSQTSRNALALIHERVLLEACRCLAYTGQPISLIAWQLGFTDPAYFTRFFRRGTGMSPRDYRNRAESGQLSGASEATMAGDRHIGPDLF